jgi:c-di-GMP-binding flagellar brake protein YcgR
MGIERRRHERIDIAIEVRVRGRGKDGRPIEESTLSGNISSSGCALLLAHALDPGSELDLRFLCPAAEGRQPQVLAFRGSVVRSAPINQAQHIVGVQFLKGAFPMDFLG